MTDHERALRLSEEATKVMRLDGFVYASVGSGGSGAADVGAVTEHCRRVGIDARCSADRAPGVVDVIRRRADTPSVAVIIPTRGSSATVYGAERVMVTEAIRSLASRTSYPNIEFIVVADTDTPPGVRNDLLSIPGVDVSIVEFDRPFNFAAKINLGAAHTEAEYLLLMNDDIEVKSGDVIEVLLSYLVDESIGMVGPVLFFEDGNIQSAGHLFNPVPFDLYRGYPASTSGGDGMLRATREVSSVIAAFAMTRASHFREAGGLCEEFPGDYNDVDYCLKLGVLGRRTVVTPVVECVHFESKTRVAVPDPVAVGRLGARWQHIIENDPFGNRHLQPYEFIWKADVDTQPALRDALGVDARWNGTEWGQLQLLAERNLHRTMYHPKWIEWVAQ